VGSEDLQHVYLALGNGAEVSGKIVVEGQSTQPIEPRQIRVMLVPDAGPMMGGFFGGGPQETKDDLTLLRLSRKAQCASTSTCQQATSTKSIRMRPRCYGQAVEFKNNDRFHGVEVVISSGGDD
jgi:hypothetical protein